MSVSYPLVSPIVHLIEYSLSIDNLFVFLVLMGSFAVPVTARHRVLRIGVALSLLLGIPQIVIGLTVVSMGTSAPELFVSLLSTIQGGSGGDAIAVSNVVGSNIFNVLIVLGASAAVMPLRAGSQPLQAVLTLDLPLAAFVAQRLGAAPLQTGAEAGEATAECLNLLAGRMAGRLVTTHLTLGVPSVQDPGWQGEVIVKGAWRTAEGVLSMTVESNR